jgi:hypothetical protein
VTHRKPLTLSIGDNDVVGTKTQVCGRRRPENRGGNRPDRCGRKIRKVQNEPNSKIGHFPVSQLSITAEAQRTQRRRERRGESARVFSASRRLCGGELRGCSTTWPPRGALPYARGYCNLED